MSKILFFRNILILKHFFSFFDFQKPPSVFDLLKSQMAEVAKNKKRGLGGGGGGGMVTDNFMRQFRDSDSLELKKLSAAQFMEVWEHYDSDGKTISYA